MALNPKEVIDPFKKLHKLLKKVGGQPTPEEVHDIRTRTRRIESTLQALPDACGRNEERLLKHATKLRRRAGKVRDMDVLSGYTRKLDIDGEQDCITELIEHLGAQRYQYGGKLVREVKRRRGQLKPRLRKTIKKLRSALPQRRDGKADELSQEAATDVLRLSAELREPPHLNRSNLHPYRLKVKELRYLLQDAQPEPDKQLIDTLGEVKDKIGEWHDWEELIAITENLLDKPHTGCKLVPRMREISDEKFEQALASAERMRKQFFPPRRGAAKRGASRRLPQPILVATERMAA